MQVVGAQTSKPVISSDHDHDISFYTYSEDINSLARIDTLGVNSNVVYVVFKGDPSVTYTFGSNTSPEMTRLKKLANTAPVTKVMTNGNQVTLDLDFDVTPVNTLITLNQSWESWISPDVPYLITTKTTAPLVTRLELDKESSTVVKIQYCLLDDDTVEINTPTKKIVYTTDQLNVNGEEVEPGKVANVDGNATLSSSSTTGVIIIEYTD